MKGEGCYLTSSAASGLLHEIQSLSQWLRADLAYLPFFPPDNNPGEEIVSCEMRIHMSQAEYFRATILPQQTQKWVEDLPQVPRTTEELRAQLTILYESDERRVLLALAELGSVSASILVYLDLTRDMVAFALKRLHEDRAAQTNLTEILGATRYRILAAGKLYRTMCPKRYCYQRDSFLHMLDCFHLTDSVKRGSEALPFLLHMARSTKRKEGHPPYPYLEPLTALTRLQDAAPDPPSPMALRSNSSHERAD